MDRPRIAIIGAGLGGTTAAILLHRAGYRVRVYEQAPQLARIGAGINLGANVMRIAHHLGLATAMYDIGIAPTRHLSREWDTGRVLFDAPLDRWAEAYGARNLIMHRGDLQAVLAGALPDGIITFDRRLIDMRPRGAGVQMVFADASRAEADIVIGADGVNSSVREILLGPEPPIYTGFVAYRAIFPAARMGRRRLASDFAKWWSDERHPAAEDRHFLVYYLTRARNEIYIVTGSPHPEWPGDTASVPATMAEIKACYEGFHQEVQDVIDACPQASKWPLQERTPFDCWSTGAAVLLGDACHPMKPHMGQGANMAMEDAVVLVRCLQHCADPADAFRLYEANRIDRTSRVQRESHVNTWMKHDTDPGWVFAYDALTVPLLPPTPAPQPQFMEPS